MNIAGTKAPESNIKSGLCNDLSSEQTKMIVDKFTPESKALFSEKCNATILDTKKLYIRLTDDKELSVSVQDKMAKNLNAQKVETLHSGHLPMLSNPDALTKILNDFCKDV